MLIGSITLSYAQSVPFLNFPSDARTVAMGNAGYILASPFAVQHNTAAMMSDYAPETAVAASYLMWQPQATNSSLIQVAGYTKYNNAGFAAGFRHHTLGAIEKTDDQGNITGTFSPSEYTAELGFGYKIKTNLALGVAIRYINSDMGGEKKASAIASDISMLYNHKNLNIGLGCSNVGSKINYGYSEYSLPARMNTGLAYHFSIENKHSVTGVADVAYQLSSNHTGLASGIGAEYTYNKLVSFRTGYHFENESIGSSYATVGCGAHFSGFSIDVAYILAQNNNPMCQTMMISVKWEK
jgi:hypothetical protein